ncbi:MAG TPA: Cys-tRNA(Pro) deacylase [Bacteroidota bacterium]|nr:Cys-tRNA(Pro) deacylase [Bacteroidota bacterium]
MKTNAIRILEARYISHEIVTYACDDEHIDAVSVAQSIGAPEEQVFKTLVARGDKTGVLVFCIPGNFELHLKKAATVSGNKSIEMVKAKELLPLTGYIRGGCSPVGMKKPFPTWIDETAILHERIYVSAGVRGTQMLLDPHELLLLVDGSFADLV